MPAPIAPSAPAPAAAPEPDPIDSLPNHEDASSSAAPPPAPKAIMEAPKPETKTPETPKPETKKPADDSIDDLPTEPKATPKPEKSEAPPAPVAEPKTPKELRAAYESTKGEADKLRSETQELRKQIELAKKAGAEESTKALREELDTLTKERQELSDKVRYLNYRESKEYADKYQEPLKKAWQDALTDIEGMVMEKEDGTSEQVTANHLTQLLQMPAGQAATAASKLFGPAAPEILAHRRAIIGIQKASQAALDEWKTKGSELTASQERQQAEQHQARIASFEKGVSDFRESMPELFGRPTDPEAAVFFDKGEKLVKLAFRGEGLPEGLTPEQRSARVVSAQATLAARAASFGPQRHQLIKANARIKELEAEIEGYKQSEPNPASIKAAPSAADVDDLDAGIDALPTVN